MSSGKFITKKATAREGNPPLSPLPSRSAPVSVRSKHGHCSYEFAPDEINLVVDLSDSRTSATSMPVRILNRNGACRAGFR